MLNTNNVKDFFNSQLDEMMKQYEQLENEILFDDLTEKQESEKLELMEHLQNEQGRITFHERKPLIEALKVASQKDMLANRENYILDNPLTVEFSEGGKVAHVLGEEESDGYRNGFAIVVKSFGSQSIGKIVG